MQEIEIKYSQVGLKCSYQNDTFFYWKATQEPDEYNKYRIAGEDDQKRNPEDLPKEEIVCGIKETLTNQISLPEEDLIREVAKIFGYARLGGNVEQAMKMGIEFAFDRELIGIKNGRIVLTEIKIQNIMQNGHSNCLPKL